MSAEVDCSKLTIDPGVHYLARLFDALQAKVDACCTGHGIAPSADTSSQEPSAQAAENTALREQLTKANLQLDALRGQVSEANRKLEELRGQQPTPTPAAS